MKIPKEKFETRQFRKTIEIRAKETEGENYIVTGYAMKFEPYVLFESDEGPVYEEFPKKCFENTDMSDVIMLYDHQGRVFARTSNNTLKVELDDTGMLIEADLSSNTESRQLYDDIKSGLITKMSWSFAVGSYRFEEDANKIVHESVRKVYDVSAVGIPANDDTTINARNFVDGVIDKIQAERLEERKRKLKLKLEIEKAMED